MTILSFGLPSEFLDRLAFAGMEVVVDLPVERARAAASWHGARGLVWAFGRADADAAISRLRMEPACDGLPAIAVLTRGEFASVAAAFAAGADDVVTIDAGAGVADRLAPREPFDEPAGRALVWSRHASRRRAFARVLRRSGFDVRTSRESDAASAEAHPDVVVADPEIARAVLGAKSPTSPWVVCSDPIDPGLGRRLGEIQNVALHDPWRAPEEVLHHLNRMRSVGIERRSSKRTLWSAPVRWRHPGRDESHWGTTFDLSSTGIFVRTLGAPPPGTDLWLEVRPPGAPRRVHLEARVVWRRETVVSAPRHAPAGMALAVTGVTATDEEVYVEAHERISTA